MKLKKILVMMATLVLLGSFAVEALAVGPARSGYQNRLAGAFTNPKLQLTLEQRQKLLTNRYQYEKDTLELRFALKQKSLELRSLWKAKVLDQKAIESKAQEVTTLKVQLAVKKQALFADNLSVFTPEQRKIFDTVVKKGHPGRPKRKLKKTDNRQPTLNK